MPVHNVLSVEDYREKLKNCVAIVDCFSLDSADCKTIAPILVKHSEDAANSSFNILKLNKAGIPELVEELGVTETPSFTVFKNGEKVGGFVGCDQEALEQLFAKHRADADALKHKRK